MSSDSHLIYYSTIHLNRREEILIQSIISLYNSKDNYKWIYREINDEVTTIVVGSEAKALIASGSDPFILLDDKHIIIMLGDLFYPKNARALVRVALPIKALDLVEKLGYIEKNIIYKPVTVGYIAANMATAMMNVSSSRDKENIPPPSDKDSSIDFVTHKFTAGQEVLESSNNAVEVKKDINADLVELSATDQHKKELVQTAENKILKPDHSELLPQTEQESEIKLDNFPSVKFTFPEDEVTQEPEVSNDTSTQINTDLDSLQKTFDNVSLVADNTVTQVFLEDKVETTVTSKDTIDYVSPTKKLSVISKEIEAPTLTEVVPKHIHADNVVPLHSNIVRPAVISPAAVVSQPGVSQAVISDVGSNVIITPEVTSSVAINEQSQLDNEPEKAISQRIKLLRWPKSEVIQRHPGNAILASMVINIPMSVEDMAKQSDLPLQICQKFVDAVIDSHVAVYVDLPETATHAVVNAVSPSAEVVEPQISTVEAPQPEEKKQKRKGILYRIRAALGLLRK